MKRALFCPPTYFEIRDVKNPYMTGAQTINRDLAQQQWEALTQAFRDAGCQVETIEPVPDLEDMVFAANQVFVGDSPKYGKFIVPSRMRYPSRAREVPYYVEWFRSRGYKVINLDFGDDFLEGHGDLLWIANTRGESSSVFAGYGFRSSRGGVEKFADAMRKMEISVIPLELINPSFYHLDTCLTPLRAGAAMVVPEAFSADALATVKKMIPRLYEVDPDDASKFVCNGVAVNGKFITPHLTQCVARALENEGLEPVLVNTSEFEKSGGSVFCLKAFID